MTTQITPKELAVEFGTDAKTLRKFLRSTEGFDRKVGKGHRWEIARKDVRSLRKRFDAWVAARTPATPDDAHDAPDAD